VALDSESHLTQRLTEKGILQLLFDFRFLCDILAGGKPYDSSSQEAASEPKLHPEIGKRREENDSLESSLQVASPSLSLPLPGFPPSALNLFHQQLSGRHFMPQYWHSVLLSEMTNLS
jgi:hypothetical protein